MMKKHGMADRGCGYRMAQARKQRAEIEGLCRVLYRISQYLDELSQDTERSMVERNQAEQLYARVRCVLSVVKPYGHLSIRG